MARVLLVEDSKLILQIMKDILESEGNEVITAEDGETALRLFLEEKPDIVITDCLIPKMNGFKLVKNIRELETENRVPVLMTSAIYKKANYRQVALDAGADQFVFKPTTPEDREEFKRRFNELIGMNSMPDHSSEVHLT